jgi:nitronate monooxygenase
MSAQTTPGVSAVTDSITTLPVEPLPDAECAELLNMLLEAERAGARLLADYVAALPLESEIGARLRQVQRDEAKNCAVLYRLLLEIGVTPSMAVGSFYDKGLAIEGLHQRLEFLNRGQAWVAKRIAAALPRIERRTIHEALLAMHRSHVENIDRCEELNDRYAPD